MTGFTIHLLATATHKRIDSVRSFVGQDASGYFGLWSGHEAFMTVLTRGLHRYQRVDEKWIYLALAGGLLRFDGDQLRISSPRFLENEDYRGLAGQLDAELRKESDELSATRASVQHLERELLRRLLKTRG